MGHQNHFERVRGLVSGHSGVPRSEIGMETRLVEDLGIDGDTGHELLEAFADEFGVDMSRMAPFNYFDDEPPLYWFSSVIPLLAMVSPSFRRHVRHATRGRRALTVRALVRSARARSWIRPDQARTDIDPLRLTGRTTLAALVLTAFTVALAAASVAVLRGSNFAGAWAAVALLAVLWALLAAKIVMALNWLRRLDAAARFEEQHLTAAD